MKKLYLSIMLLLLSAAGYAVGFNIDSLQNALDDAIEHSSEYEKDKIERIEQLRVGKDYYKLFEEYQSYVCDSALYYINLEIARQIDRNDKDRVDLAMIKKAQVLSVSGLYLEALEQLRMVDPLSLSKFNLAQYYKSYADLYLYLAEYSSEDEFRTAYLNKMNAYQDSILQVGADSFLTYTTQTSLYLANRDYASARSLLESHLKSESETSRNYAILTSTLSFICSVTDDRNAERAYLTMSAIADIKAVVKENKSLRSLAEILYNEGELKKADYYMQISMEDANFYNARLRNVQISKMLPVINRAYSNVESNRKTLLGVLAGILGLFVVALVLVVVYVRREHKKIEAARDELRMLNQQLSIANSIKEEYLGKFLEMCSVYIDNLENYRKTLNKKASGGKMDDVIKALKQNNITDDVLNEFYNRFDEAFLKIHPRFIEQFNSLLPENERIVPKTQGRLSTELRIYALIRLGINDSNKISEFLHYSITTIYTYRSKIKNKSLYPDDFESRIMQF